MLRTLKLAAIALAGLGTAASADHYMQSADPQVVGMINTIVGMYQQGCQMGNPMGCELAQMAMSEGHYLLNAGYECMRGNQEACWFYQQGTQAAYNNMMQMQQAQLGGGGNPLGATHEERMTNIHNWGQSRLEWGNQQSAIMDQRHEQFMQTLRN
ncbi:hypothetical protein [Histidinibacterium lentulum]|nr:hypothetical protein [Histidinibacterium lentulum]